MVAAARSAIQVESLAIGFAEPLHAAALDFTVHAGATLCILGPNGSGKTTLLRTLIGLMQPLHGRVLIDGAPLDRYSDAQRARTLAYVPQAMDTALDIAALDIVIMGRAPHLNRFAVPAEKDLALAHAALGQLGIAALASRSYARMSAGERQLTLIARAIAQDAPLIILDEPAAHLDLGNQERVLDTLARLTADGKTVAYSSHHPQHAMQADAVVLLGREGIVAHGAPREVLDPVRLLALYGLQRDTLVRGLAAR